MKSTTKRLGLAMAMLVLMIGSAERATAGVSLGWTGPSDGDNMTMTFSGFFANELTGITGGGYAHNHGTAGVVFGLDLLIDGTWTTIDSTTLPANQDVLLSTAFAGPTSFTGGTITGLRLTDVPLVGNGYHGMYGSGLASGVTTFHFDTVAPVPEPSTLAMGGTAGLLGLAYAWRRRRSKPAPCRLAI